MSHQPETQPERDPNVTDAGAPPPGTTGSADSDETDASTVAGHPSSTGQESETTSGERPDPAAETLSPTRTSAWWAGVVIFGVLLVLLLIFIAQNTRSVPIHYFTFTGHLPLAVAMLAAAVVGILLTAIAGTLRILQIRRRVKRARRAQRGTT